MMTRTSHGLFGDYDASIAAMTAAVREAQRWVHVEIYIMAWDHTDAFGAMVDAVHRGECAAPVRPPRVPEVPRLPPDEQADDHGGDRWHQMMPIHPLKGRWRRPDLRNHRKLLVVDGEVAFMGSQNMIDMKLSGNKNVKSVESGTISTSS